MTERGHRDVPRALLDVGAELFSSRGLRGTRIQEIVQRSGVNERMIYHHFESKEGLYRAVLADQWSGLDAAWTEVIADAAKLDPARGVEAAFMALPRLFSEWPLVPKLVLHEAMNGWEGLPTARLDQIPSALRALYMRGQRVGVFRKDVGFESLYLTIMGAVGVGPILRGRFQKAPRRGGPSLESLAVQLILDGARTPARRRRTGGTQ